jgi:hypothetical protein
LGKAVGFMAFSEPRLAGHLQKMSPYNKTPANI